MDRRGSSSGVHKPSATAARRISAVSVAWTLASSVAAIAFGLASNTSVLVAFGAVGLVDATGSMALVYHFAHALRHDRFSEGLERAAHRVVLTGLVMVGAISCMGGISRAVGGDASETTAAALAFTAAALIGAALLADRKRTIAIATHSPALLSDSHVSAIGAGQASVVLLGAAATELLGWARADGIATCVIGAGAVVLAVRTWWQELRTGPALG